MIRSMRWGDRARRGALPVTAVAAAEVGHWLVYRARFGAGPVPGSVQTAHGYLPALLTVVTALAGAGFLAGLLLVAAARGAAGRAEGRRSVRRPALIDLWACLFVLQLVIFGIQESVEATAAGGATLSPAELLLWGVLGQLPASLLAALLLRWAATRFEIALDRLRAGLSEPAAVRLAAAAPPLRRPVHRPLPADVAGAGLRKRGPPRLSTCPGFTAAPAARSHAIVVESTHAEIVEPRRGPRAQTIHSRDDAGGHAVRRPPPGGGARSRAAGAAGTLRRLAVP